MATTAWLNSSGAGLLNAGGALLLCESCPCDDDCYADCIAAIAERQITTDQYEWSYWKSANPPTLWTLDEAKTVVGEIATATSWARFVYPYSGGSADGPTLMTADYAAGAADWCELLELVKAMVTVRTYLTATMQLSYGQTSPSLATEALAKAHVEANWSIRWVGAGYIRNYSVVSRASNGLSYIAFQQCGRWDWTSRRSALRGLMAKDVRIFNKMGEYFEGSGVQRYHTFGHVGVPSAPNIYELVYTFTDFVGDTITRQPVCGNSSGQINEWFSPEGIAPGQKNLLGYGNLLGAFALVDWKYAYR